MSAANTRCPKCNSEMVQGFIVDWQSGLGVTNWVEGAPEKSFWTGAKVGAKKRIFVGAFRCTGCGFLESYALPEFAPK
jgi:Domain of unknown function (DUF6487)